MMLGEVEHWGAKVYSSKSLSDRKPLVWPHSAANFVQQQTLMLHVGFCERLAMCCFRQALQPLCIALYRVPLDERFFRFQHLTFSLRSL
jgi:hypothetical protein